MIRYNVQSQTMVDAVAVAVITAVMMLAFGGWIFMLLLGMFAGYMAMPGLALGYWASVGVLFLVRMVFMRVESS